MKKRLSVIAVLLSLLMVFTPSFSSCSFSFNLDTLKYEEFDFAELDDALHHGETVLNKYSGLTESDILTASGVEKLNIITLALSTANEIYYKLYDAIVLANLRHDKDTTETYYKNEYNRLMEHYDEYYARFTDLHYKAVCLPCAMTLFKDEEYINDIKHQHEITSAENYAALSSNINKIGQEYIDNYYNAKDIGKLSDHQEEIGNILIRQAKEGKALAKATGYDSYAEYVYENNYYRSYTPSDSKKICTYVKETISPLLGYYYNSDGGKEFTDEMKKIYNDMTEEKTIGSSKYPVHNGKKITDLYNDTISSFVNDMGSDYKESYNQLKTYHLYQPVGQTENSDVAYEGSYTSRLLSSNHPFIYQHYYIGDNALSLAGNITSFIHEFGHFNAYIADSPNNNDLDICEIHSQGLEMLFTPYFEDMFGTKATQYYTSYNVYNTLVSAVAVGCYLDELQQYVYENCDTITPADISSYSRKLYSEYNLLDLVWAGMLKNNLWLLIPHTFESPFYYISYAVSAIPALEILAKSITDWDSAAESYKSLVSQKTAIATLGEDTGLPSLFEKSTYTNLAATIIQNEYVNLSRPLDKIGITYIPLY